LLLVAAALSLLPLDALAATFVPVDYPGALRTFAFDIDAGTVVGRYDDANGDDHGFIFDGSTYMAFDHPSGVSGTRLTGISGTNIVGSYFDASNVRHGFLYDGSSYTAINVPGSLAGTTIVHGMSGSNIVGEYTNASNEPQGFLYDGLSYTTISHPSSPTYTTVYGVDGTNIVGSYAGPGGYFTGFRYDGSSYTTILPPGALASMIQSGDLDGNTIVGDYADSSFRVHGLVYDGTSYSTLDHPLGYDTTLSGIQGNMIVGYYSVDGSILLASTTEFRSFIAIVPEPSTLLLAALGMTGVVFLGRRCRRCVACPRIAAAVFVLLAAFAADARAVAIATVPIGNAGNAPDQLWASAQNPANLLFGSVAYDYRIGTTEVTNAQYAAFLNAQAASDPLNLYNTLMGSDARGGITRSGSVGSYSYAVKPNMGDKPVNLVSWYDAIRFANWLHNGQGSGSTESGAYTLQNPLPDPGNGLSITRNSGATWFLTSEDEWYKAAYHQPAAQGGDSDDYWLYPTASNTAPTVATADSIGNISNPGANVANRSLGADWNSQNGNVTTVGSAGPLSTSYYGTSDQGGNVYEWNEALISGTRGLRGGSWSDSSSFLAASSRTKLFPPLLMTSESFDVGFRVATVPEPSTLLLAGLSSAALALVAGRLTPPSGGTLLTS
jgi:formylglycine-generating enzyme required for sulfatase activity